MPLLFRDFSLPLMMEPHKQSYELTAASSLTSQQLEVYRLYQMCGVNMTNEKFKVKFRISLIMMYILNLRTGECPQKPENSV